MTPTTQTTTTPPTAPASSASSAAEVYSLPALPYEFDALSPVLSAELMDLHYNKHHASYVKKSNELTGKLVSLKGDDDPSALLGSLSFNVSAHALHSLFWESMTPGSSSPSAALTSEITRAFGSMEALRAHLSAAVAKLSGSGWAALSWEPMAKRLAISQLHDHQNNVIVGSTPLLVIDGWEHAYYLDYHADREAWGTKFFDIADWAKASERLENARSATPKG